MQVIMAKLKIWLHIRRGSLESSRKALFIRDRRSSAEQNKLRDLFPKTPQTTHPSNQPAALGGFWKLAAGFSFGAPALCT